MTQVIKRNLGILLAVAVATFAFVALSQTVRAQEAPSEVTIEGATEESTAETEAISEEDEATEESTSDDAYSFVAQPGDSYTKIARKAVQIYGFDNTVDLSGAQIVYIETNLTLLAGSPELVVGESVSVIKSTIGEWVEKAKALTEDQKSAWQFFADRVDFNTNNVGEARQ